MAHVRQLVFPYYLMCLEGGGLHRALKRYSRVKCGLPQEDCRERLGLEADYPMTAENSSEKRTRSADPIRLGKPDWRA